jgi:hypothetical protein
MKTRSIAFSFALAACSLVACGGQLATEDATPDSGPSPAPSTTAPTPSGTATTPDKPPVPPPAPSPEPVSCPTRMTVLSGATSIASTVALGLDTYHLEWPTPGNAGRLLSGSWNGPTHAVSGSLTPDTGTTFVEKLSGDTWAASEALTDSATRRVTAYRGLTRLGSFAIPNGSLDRTYAKEGVSPDGSRAVFPGRNSALVADALQGSDGWEKGAVNICAGTCELLWGKGPEIFVVEQLPNGSRELVKKAFSNPGGALVRVADPTQGRAIVAVTANRIFFDGPYDDLPPIVLDRATLGVVPFVWEAYEDIREVRERNDGYFDIFSIYSGEIASAKLVAPDGTIVRNGSGHAAYGSVSAGTCGFWIDGRLLPYADGESPR